MHTYLRFVFTIGLCSALCACSSKKTDEPKELEDPSVKEALEISLDTPETTLLANGKKYFNTGLYSLARQNFEALRTGYPLSQYVEFAEIKIADCLYESSEFVEASKAYEDFVKAHPASEAYPYMLFRAARSHHLSHRGVGRDTAPLDKALELYNRALNENPDSAYAESAKLYRSEVVNALAEHDERILKFYKKQNREAAVVARTKMYQEKWIPVIQETAYAPAVTEPAKEVEALPPVNLQATTRSAKGESIPLQGRLLKIECTNSGARGVFVYFDRETPLLSAYRASQRLPVRDGRIMIAMPGISAPEQTSSCFGQGDLALSKDGTVSIRSTVAGSAIGLNNPPRLFISVPTE